MSKEIEMLACVDIQFNIMLKINSQFSIYENFEPRALITSMVISLEKSIKVEDDQNCICIVVLQNPKKWNTCTPLLQHSTEKPAVDRKLYSSY